MSNPATLRPAVPGHPLQVLSAMAFLGALLSFSMEPMAGRMLLPRFGGSAHVWLTCVMFFQGMLFLAYAYAHLAARRLGAWHLLLLLLPLVALPPLAAGQATGTDAPLPALLAALFTGFAMPFAALSTTAVVAQAWLADSRRVGKVEPYPLYAASNAGSFLGLLGYPLLVEPFTGLELQAALWTVGYAAYLALAGWAWATVRPASPAVFLRERTDDAADENRPTLGDYSVWLALSSTASAFLLAVTNKITIEVGSFPLVWVLPLAVYLASFIVTFRVGGGVPRFLRPFWLECGLLGLIAYRLPPANWGFVLAHLAALGAMCILAHGELYARRPGPSRLTGFYLAMALGGWLGGAFVSLLAPILFTSLQEYPLALAAFLLTFAILRRHDARSFWRNRRRVLTDGRILGLAGIALLAVATLPEGSGSGELAQIRTFYGIYTVTDSHLENEPSRKLRLLTNGATLHGSQLLAPQDRHVPTSYYGLAGHLGSVIDMVASPRRMAVIGLGSGTVAAHARNGDSLTFYELDPACEGLARQWFSYLADSRGKVRVVAGDGRLAMAGEREEVYDLILVDAFSGDGIPAHLLTVEALRAYLERLTPEGLLLVHTSNRYYDLAPVLEATAGRLGLAGIQSPDKSGKDSSGTFSSTTCVVLARTAEPLRPLKGRGWPDLSTAAAGFTPWTDDHIDMLAPLLARLRQEASASRP